MSQNTENQVQVSEDLFTTQDLLDDPIHLENETTSKSPQNEAQSLDLNNLQSEDLEVQESADYDIAASDELMEEELEPEIDDTEGITEDIEEDLEVRDEITEGTEVEVAEVVQEVVEGTEKDASKKKVVRVSSLQRISELPLSKVKHIIKLDPDVKLVSSKLN